MPKDEDRAKSLEVKLKQCIPELIQTIHIDTLFLTEAIRCGALASSSRVTINAKPDDHEKVDYLLDHIRRDIICRYDGLVKALVRTEQWGAVRILEGEESMERYRSLAARDFPETSGPTVREFQCPPTARLLFHFTSSSVNDIAWFSDGSMLVGSSATSKSLKRIHFNQTYSEIQKTDTLCEKDKVCRVSTGPKNSWSFCNDNGQLFVNINGEERHWNTTDTAVIGVTLLRNRIIFCTTTEMHVCDDSGKVLFTKELTSDAIQFTTYRGDNYLVFTTGQPGTEQTLSFVKVNEQSSVESITVCGEDKSNFKCVAGVACDNSDSMFVIDHGDNTVYLYSKDGRYMGQLDLEEPEGVQRIWTLSLLERSDEAAILAVSDGFGGNILLYELVY